MIQFIVAAALAGLLLGGSSAWYFTASYKDAVWSAATNKLQVDAADLLQEETVKAIKIEREASIKVRELEAQHVREEKDLAVIERRNRQLATELGGLRDPGRRPSCPDAVSTTPTSAGSAEKATDSGYLSAEASGVLLDAAAEVDALANYALMCYQYIQSIQLTKENEQ